MDRAKERRMLQLDSAWGLSDRVVAVGAVLLALLTVALLVKGP